jgi:hypothetical protein
VSMNGFVALGSAFIGSPRPLTLRKKPGLAVKRDRRRGGRTRTPLLRTLDLVLDVAAISLERRRHRCLSRLPRPTGQVVPLRRGFGLCELGLTAGVVQARLSRQRQSRGVLALQAARIGSQWRRRPDAGFDVVLRGLVLDLPGVKVLWWSGL